MLDRFLNSIDFNYTEENVKQIVCYSTLWGLLVFSVSTTVYSLCNNYKIKIIIVSREPQN
jgi:hypothetical protein